MRTVLRYENGRAVWSENTPAHATHPGLRGQLVVGHPGPVEQQRINQRKSRTPEQRAAAYQRTKRYLSRHGEAA